MPRPAPTQAIQLVLADGRTFRGRGFGAVLGEPVVGEVVFNTSMTGYQEILTDPSYCGQIVVMTQPLIGNYGVNREDVENRGERIWPRAFVVREVSPAPSSRRAERSLPDYLASQGVAGMDEVDTRALTRHLRDRGAMTGGVAPAATPREEVTAAIEAWGSMEGRDLLGEVTCAESYTVPAAGRERFRVAAWDTGAKRSIFERLAAQGISVRVHPVTAGAGDLLADDPDGLFLPNGPGDPAACRGLVDEIRSALGTKPIFGICLGHQLLALAAGARTYKLPFGHHGANHPVREEATGRVEITSQNHGFAVDAESLGAAGGLVTHVNLNDGSVEGFALPERRAFTVQYHPEAAPGPHDATHLFGRMARLLEERR